MTNIEGYMGRGPLKWLRKMGAIHMTVVEVGAWLGRGTNALAANCKGTVYAVDTWEGVPDDPHQQKLYNHIADPFATWRENVGELYTSGKVVPIRDTSTNAAATFAKRGQMAGFVFIDADHRYEAVKADIEAWRPIVKHGGILSGHDFHWPGVEQAVREIFGDDYQRGPGSIWWVRV